MCCEYQHRADASVIHMRGRFVFSCNDRFRDACAQVLARAETRAIHVDLGQVEYLDSSALGMLLLLKEKGEAMGKNIQIRGARGVARQVLEVANFHGIFDMAP